VNAPATVTRKPRRSGGTGSLEGARPDRYSKLSWITAFFMVLFHVGAVWALIDFTWSGVVVLLVTYYISLAWGIGMSYHRLLTHRSYKTPKGIEYFLTVVRHTGARRRSALLGGHTPAAPPALRQ
jgi:fatty-acid desaturase